ncbi:MAG: GNAT family N-acetyltransferase [Candidatus Nanoarchaeia archaeon]
MTFLTNDEKNNLSNFEEPNYNPNNFEEEKDLKEENKEIIHSRSFQEGDYEEYIQKLTRDSMKDFFVKHFGGWSDKVSKQKLFKVLKEGVVELFFNDHEKFVGYVSFNPEKNDKNSLLINDIHVVKLFQRKSYGYQILQHVIACAKKANMKQIKVFVFKDNYAVNFYKKNGFEIQKDLEKSNSVIMVKKL